jgi:aromatic ring hydroxylase
MFGIIALLAVALFISDAMGKKKKAAKKKSGIVLPSHTEAVTLQYHMPDEYHKINN